MRVMTEAIRLAGRLLDEPPRLRSRQGVLDQAPPQGYPRAIRSRHEVAGEAVQGLKVKPATESAGKKKPGGNRAVLFNKQHANYERTYSYRQPCDHDQLGAGGLHQQPARRG